MTVSKQLENHYSSCICDIKEALLPFNVLQKGVFN